MIPQSGKPDSPVRFEVDSVGGQFPLRGESRILYIACEGTAKLYFTEEDWKNDQNWWPLFGDENSGQPQRLDIAVRTLWLKSTSSVDAQVTILNVLQA